MTTQFFIALVFAMVLSVYVAIATRTWVRVRGRRVVVCPETQKPVTVTLDVGRAMATAVWEKADLALTSCTRWPERKDCDQACVRQIEIAPFDTLPKELARRYFMEQHCSICQRPIEPPGSITLHPGFMHPITHKVNSWDEIAP